MEKDAQWIESQRYGKRLSASLVSLKYDVNTLNMFRLYFSDILLNMYDIYPYIDVHLFVIICYIIPGSIIRLILHLNQEKNVYISM